jgi:hypothetical protein
LIPPSRTVVVMADGKRGYTGAFHAAWICDGNPVDAPTYPEGITPRPVDLRGCPQPEYFPTLPYIKK